MLKKITTIVGLTLLAIVPSISIAQYPAHADIALSSTDIFGIGFLIPIKVEVKIKLVESNNIQRPISNQQISFESHANVLCVKSPCFEREWIGLTNDQGELSIPPGLIFDLTTITVKGFQPKELSRKEFEQPKSNDRHDTQDVRLKISLDPKS